MQFLYTYTPGKVPESEMEEYLKQWGVWIGRVNQKSGIRVNGGKVVSWTKVQDYTGEFGGASIVETESLDKAVNVAKGCPGLKYGGTGTVLQESAM